MGVLVVLGGLWVANTRTVVAPGGGGTVCTMDAKLCSDGSYVGRTGPNCEFSECPPDSGPTALRASIGQQVSALDVSITPLTVLQDSRCPAGVQCIWAGTVKLTARLSSGLGTATQEFTLGEPITTEAEMITLKEVFPSPTAGVTIPEGDYVFQFEVAKRTESVPASVSGVRGTVMLGPTCPVMRDPPDPECADKGYATTIVVRRAGSSTIVASGKSDATGVFTLSLPPGSYTITAGGGTVFPSCSPIDAVVPTVGYITADISCDTGIR